MKMKQSTFEQAVDLASELGVGAEVLDVQHGTVHEGVHPVHGKMVIYTGVSGPSFFVVE